MVRLTAFPTAPSWFVVVPDGDMAAPAVAAVRRHASRRIDHPSGRPWILGQWHPDALVMARVGGTAVAVLGQQAVRERDLTTAARSLVGVGDVDRVARSLVGSVHLIASVDGTTRVQGSVTGLRRVFTARVGRCVCAADRADVLAHLIDAAVDERRLALQLLEPPILFPVAGMPVWRDVDGVPTDHHVVLTSTGAHRLRRWWRPPVPDRSLRDGAAALRGALSEAVAARVGHRRVVSSDLGGVDSTAVCCVAARTAPKVLAFTAASPDPLADDVDWARRTVAATPVIEHHVISADEMPLVYHGLTSVDDPLDEPCTVAVDRTRWLTIADRAVAAGSDLHLVGFGGDELLYGSIAHLHDAVRTQPRQTAHHLRGFTAKYRWPRGRVVRQLADRRPYGEWLAGVADAVAQPARPPDEPLLAWGFEPRLPPWVTGAAAAGVRDLIRNRASAVEPHGSGHGQHRELEAMRFVSRIARQFEQMAARRGLTMAAPYYDDRVVEAGLSVRPLERVTPWRYKPLIAEAMHGIVPDGSNGRQTKANGTVDEEPGLRRHRAELMTLWDDSRLGQMGLIDVDRLRRICAGPLPPTLPAGALYQTIACEVWLRATERVGAGM